ncbi:hypothetical protein BGZ96_001570 [Linnemannia gamsii]|uniref:Uncharacterized protein n=1 Tax=Linnemannia gamsii TaxID=64522 RepID=A0ABQ7JM51_9FUNG|nr:hypothetical protein BGZ96_001570 [Linnemannia gamsii]
MRSPFPSAAQAYAKSKDSATASRHHPDARLTILPLPSLAALYPMDHSAASSSSSSPSSSSSSPSATAPSSSSLSSGDSLYCHAQQQQQQYHNLHHQRQPSYQSYDRNYQKSPPRSHPTPTPSPSPDTQTSINNKAASPSPSLSNKHEYMGTNMESLLDAVEVHSTLFASSASSTGSLSPPATTLSLSSAPSSPAASDLFSITDFSSSSETATATFPSSGDSHFKRTQTSSSPSLRRMSISNLVDDLEPLHQRAGYDQVPTPEANQRPRLKPMLPRPSSPLLSANHVTHKRKWSRLSTHTSEDPRNTKVRRSIHDLLDTTSDSQAVTRSFNMTPMVEGIRGLTSMLPVMSSTEMSRSNTVKKTTVTCYHAAVAQKSYGSEKRFLCPPPFVQIQGDPSDPTSVALSKVQVAMSVICESGENSPLGQRSTLEDDQSSTFRYLYVSGTAKAKSFKLKIQVYDRPCLPNGFVSGDAAQAQIAGQADADLPEPCATFDSQPITIISKPSKKTAKARNVSSCILAGSLVSLFNRINSQTVRTKYMSAQDGELCAKGSTWSAFTISIVANGPTSPSPTRNGAAKSHHRQPIQPTAAPITYGAEIILTETATGLQSDRLIVCKVENGRIIEGAIGPICQMQKVALQSTRRSADDRPLYLGAGGDDHQGGRFMDHTTATNTVLRYEPTTKTEYYRPGSDDFLCWTIVGISKFEYPVELP